MKRSKFMIGALVLSMGLLGTGYAYWTDKLQVNTTVNTGKLDVAVSGNSADIQYIYDSGSALDDEEVYKNGGAVVAEIKDAQISVTLPNMHPGTKVVIPYTVTNNSTMPIIGTVGEITTTNPDLLNMLQVVLTVDGVTMPVPLNDAVSGTFAGSLQAQLEAAYNGTVNPDATPKQFVLTIKAPENLEEEFIEGQTLGFSANVNWTQQNDHTVNPAK